MNSNRASGVLAVAGLLGSALAFAGGSSAKPTGTSPKYYVEGKRIPTPKRLPPVYPSKEHQRRIGGTVVVAFSYGVNGNVIEASVKTSSGNKHLDSAAVAAVKQWTIELPATGGPPVAGSSETSLTFTP